MDTLVLITTGGTVAMTRTEGSDGADLALGPADLTRGAGFRSSSLRVETLRLLDLPSINIGLPHLRRLVRALEAAEAGGARAIVVTHGTDTLEESAFGVELLYRGEATVVFTGAMRTADAPGADGPANLAAAAAVALDPACRGLGVLVVSGDEIHAARFVRKVHTSIPHAFSSLPLGPLGWVAEGRPQLMMRPSTRLRALRYGRRAPQVPVVGVGADTSAIWLGKATQGAAGVVFELAGGGHAPARLAPTLGRIARAAPAVFVSRTGGGSTLQNTYAYAGSETDLLSRGLIGAGALDSRKARIALSLLLSAGQSAEVVRAWFESPDEPQPFSIAKSTESSCA